MKSRLQFLCLKKIMIRHAQLFASLHQLINQSPKSKRKIKMKLLLTFYNHFHLKTNAKLNKVRWIIKSNKIRKFNISLIESVKLMTALDLMTRNALGLISFFRTEIILKKERH